MMLLSGENGAAAAAVAEINEQAVNPVEGSGIPVQAAAAPGSVAPTTVAPTTVAPTTVAPESVTQMDPDSSVPGPESVAPATIGSIHNSIFRRTYNSSCSCSILGQMLNLYSD